MKIISTISMLLKEHLNFKEIDRIPEPTTEMNDIDNILAFHQQGEENGALIPIYHFNAVAMSRLIRKGGTVVDLGSGTGQYLAYLANYRPDIQIVGIELASNMVTVGNNFLTEKGLSNRVKIIHGDMTKFSEFVNFNVDLVSSVFSLHHLPETANLLACIAQIRAIRKTCGSAIWIFDHARPKHKDTPAVFPEIFTPAADSQFKMDSTNSLIASFSFQEMSQALDNGDIGDMKHDYSKLMNLYQIHWLERELNLPPLTEIALPTLIPLSKNADRDFKSLRQLFKNLP